MKFKEILERCKGQDVIINSNEERTVVDVCDDFLVVTGGNSQMKITDFIPFEQIVKVIRADYTANNTSSISIDLVHSSGEARRSGGH